jgi:hypothetical protein
MARVCPRSGSNGVPAACPLESRMRSSGGTGVVRLLFWRLRCATGNGSLSLSHVSKHFARPHELATPWRRGPCRHERSWLTRPTPKAEARSRNQAGDFGGQHFRASRPRPHWSAFAASTRSRNARVNAFRDLDDLKLIRVPESASGSIPRAHNRSRSTNPPPALRIQNRRTMLQHRAGAGVDTSPQPSDEKCSVEMAASVLTSTRAVGVVVRGITSSFTI